MIQGCLPNKLLYGRHTTMSGIKFNRQILPN